MAHRSRNQHDIVLPHISQWPPFSERRPDEAAQDRSERFLVCIDPGHPSETSAGASAHGLSENRLNWQVAQRLARRLKALAIAYRLTKTSENHYVTNQQRAEIANRSPARVSASRSARSIRRRTSSTGAAHSPRVWGCRSRASTCGVHPRGNGSALKSIRRQPSPITRTPQTSPSPRPSPRC